MVGWRILGQWADVGMYAFEVKDLGMVGIVKPYPQMPAVLRAVNAKLSPVMKADNYRGFFSLEGMLNKQREYFATDPCCRLGSPSNELLQEMFTGWADTIWAGAEGRLVAPKPKHTFGIVTMAESGQSGKHWEALTYPKEVDPFVKLNFPYAIGGKRFAVPQGTPQNIAGIVGVGASLLGAAANLGEHVNALEGFQIKVATDSLGDMLDIIGQANAWGATFTTSPLPTAAQLKAAVEKGK